MSQSLDLTYHEETHLFLRHTKGKTLAKEKEEKMKAQALLGGWVFLKYLRLFLLSGLVSLKTDRIEDGPTTTV